MRVIEKNAKVSIAGHRGLVGGAILRNLQAKGYANFVNARASRAA